MESSVTEAIDDLATVLAELGVDGGLEREIDRAEIECEPLNKQNKRYFALLGELENTQQRDKMQNIVTEMLYQYEKAAYRAGLRDGMSVFSHFLTVIGKESRYMLDTLHNVRDALHEFFQNATNAAVCATYDTRRYRGAEKKRHADYDKAVASLTEEQVVLVEQFDQSAYE